MNGRLGAKIAAAKTFLEEGVWRAAPARRAARSALALLRFALVAQRGFTEHRLGLHAAGLTFFSILSIVPILMLMLLLTKPCGMYGWAREKLRVKSDEAIEMFFEQKGVEKTRLERLATEVVAKPSAEGAEAGKKFGRQARELRDQLLGQIDAKIESFNFGPMALAGLLLLAWTVTSTFGQVEASMNEIWRVKTPRKAWKKMLIYAGTLMLLPFLSALAMSMPVLRVVKQVLEATLGSSAATQWMNSAIVGVLDSPLFATAVTFAFATLALAFVFWLMPNRKVAARAAFEGGAVSAALLLAWLRVCVVLQFGIANSSAAYGSFALLPILIVWISFNWRIILLGSNVTYAFQCVHRGVRDLDVV